MVRLTICMALLGSMVLVSGFKSNSGHDDVPNNWFTDVQPRISGHSKQNVTVAEGDPFQLDCQVSDKGPYVLYWRRGSVIDLFVDEIHVDQENSSKKYFLNGSSLVVPNSTQSDYGHFQCFLPTNPPQEVNFLIDVKSSIVRVPDVDKLQLNESQNFTLRCEDRKFNRTLSWYYLDTRHSIPRQRWLQTGGDLQLVNVSSGIVDGVYICSPHTGGGNGGREFAVTVLMRPRVMLEHSFRAVVNGSVFTIPCTLNESHVNATLFWTFNGQVISDGNGTKHADLDTDGQFLVNHLTFDPFRREDNGIYSCIANNSAGSSEKTIKIVAIDDPDPSEDHTLFKAMLIISSVSIAGALVATAVSVRMTRKVRKLDPELQRLTEALVASYVEPIVHLRPDVDHDYLEIIAEFADGSASSITTGEYATVDYIHDCARFD